MNHSIDWKIVVIDDEADIRQVLSIVLTDAGYEVATAQDGKSGITICRQLSPQIVITDIRMPKMDGIQVLETLKKESPDIEVIVMTAFGEMKQAAKALDLDASDYITKPVSDDVLFIALKRAQNRYLSRRQIAEYLSSQEHLTFRGLAESGSLQQNLIQGSIDGALACDENETIIAVNQSLIRIIGYEEDELLDKMKISIIFTQEEKSRLDRELLDEHFGWGKRLSLFETTLLSKSGINIPVQVSATRLTDNGNRIGIIFFFKD